MENTKKALLPRRKKNIFCSLEEKTKFSSFQRTSDLPSISIDGLVLLPWRSAALAEVCPCFGACIVIKHCSFKLHLQKIWPCFGTWNRFLHCSSAAVALGGFRGFGHPRIVALCAPARQHRQFWDTGLSVLGLGLDFGANLAAWRQLSA